MDAKELMRLHVQALFTQDSEGHLVSVNEPGGAPAPRFFLGRTTQGNLWWVRQDVDSDLAAELGALSEAEPAFAEHEEHHARADRFTACLERQSAVERVWSGPAFQCPPELPEGGPAVRVTAANADLLSPYLEEWWVDAELGVPMTASLHAGRAVSVCCSVRATERAHEAGVETHPDFRGLGHGSRSVAAWAAVVRESGCVPLYSTSWENRPSLALAKGLQLEPFGADLHIS